MITAATLIAISIAILLTLNRLVSKCLCKSRELRDVPTAPGFVPLFGNVFYGLWVAVRHGCSFTAALHIIGQRLSEDSSLIPGMEEAGCFKFWFFLSPVVVITSAESAAVLLSSKTLPKSSFIEKNLPYGLLSTNGDNHHYHRRLLNPFFRNKTFQTMPAMIEHHAERVTAIIDANNGRIDSVQNLFGLFAGRILLQSAVDPSGSWINRCFTESQIHAAVCRIKQQFELFAQKLFYSFLPSFCFDNTRGGQLLAAKIEEYTQFSEDMIAQHKKWESERPECDVVPSVTALLVKEHEMDSQSFTRRDLIGEFKTFFAGGFETYVTTLTWLFHYVGNRPDVQERMRLEIDEVFADGAMTLDHLKSLKYTEAVIKETLRMQAPVPGIYRTLDRDYVLTSRSGRDVRLPADTVVLIYLWHIQRDPHHWSDPGTFDPDRFLNAAKSLPQGFVAFSSGNRNCIGQCYAMFGIAGLVSLLIRKYEVKAVDPIGSVVGVPKLTLEAERDLSFVFTKRTV